MTLHISSAYNEDLVHINAKVVEMGGLCEQMIEHSNKAVRDNNIELADKVVLLDEKTLPAIPAVFGSLISPIPSPIATLENNSLVFS